MNPPKKPVPAEAAANLRQLLEAYKAGGKPALAALYRQKFSGKKKPSSSTNKSLGDLGK